MAKLGGRTLAEQLAAPIPWPRTAQRATGHCIAVSIIASQSSSEHSAATAAIPPPAIPVLDAPLELLAHVPALARHA